MNKEEINKLEDYLKSLPKIKQNISIPVATNIGINLDDLMNAVKRLKKVPTFDDLLKENQQLKEIHDKAIKFIKNHIQETTYKYVYSNEVNVIQELHLDNEELIELLEILERSDNN